MMIQRFVLILAGISGSIISLFLSILGRTTQFPLPFLTVIIAGSTISSCAALILGTRQLAMSSTKPVNEKHSKKIEEIQSSEKTTAQRQSSKAQEAPVEKKSAPPSEETSVQVIQTPTVQVQQTKTESTNSVAEHLGRIEGKLDLLSTIFISMSKPVEFSPQKTTQYNLDDQSEEQPNVQRVTMPTDERNVVSSQHSKASQPFVKIPDPNAPPRVEPVENQSRTRLQESTGELEAAAIPNESMQRIQKDAPISKYGRQLEELDQLKRELIRLRSGLTTKS